MERKSRRRGVPRPAHCCRFVQVTVKMRMSPDLSLRGAKRRGNLGSIAPLNSCHQYCQPTWRPEREARGSALGVQSREGSYVFAGAFVISNMVLRDCHVGLRPPRNDKSGAITVLSPTCTYRQYSAGPGCPLPYNTLLILKTGPAWHRGKWPHGRGADTPALSCNTGETPAPSRCRGRGPRA